MYLLSYPADIFGFHRVIKGWFLVAVLLGHFLEINTSKERKVAESTETSEIGLSPPLPSHPKVKKNLGDS